MPPAERVERDAARYHEETSPGVRRLGDEQGDRQPGNQGEVPELEPRIAGAPRALTRAPREDDEASDREQVEQQLRDDDVVEQVAVAARESQ